jgi:hypothetical protein
MRFFKKTIFLAFIILALMPAFSQAQARWIVTGSNVRVRQSADVSSAEITKVGIGTLLTQQGISAQKVQIGNAQDYWYKVDAGGGKVGWIFGSFIKPFTASQKENIYMEMVRLRLSSASVNFADEVDLAKFLDRAIREVVTPANKAELNLARLQTLARASEKITYENYNTDPYKAFLANYKDTIFQDEVSANFYVNSRKYWELAEKSKALSIGEKVAFIAAEAPLGGECEGYVPCYVGFMNMTYGRYLKMYPRGVNADNAGNKLEEWFRSFEENPDAFDAVPAEDRASFKREFTTLKATVQAATLQNKDILLDAIAAFGRKFVK